MWVRNFSAKKTHRYAVKREGLLVSLLPDPPESCAQGFRLQWSRGEGLVQGVPMLNSK